MNWQRALIKSRVKLNEPLAGKTTFHIGGTAKIFIEPRDAGDLRLLIKLLKKDRMPYRLIGAGSNLLVSDKGVAAAVIRLSAPYFKRIDRKGNSLSAASGLMLSGLIRSAQGFGLSGLEFLAGIPGTLGGALAMNAGAWGASIGELAQEVEVLDASGRFRTLRKKNLKFSYRHSNLAEYIILGATLKLAKGTKARIAEQIKKYLEYRRLNQDNSLPNAGCVFRNPQGNSAGKLIDLCGLKGKSVGGACVSSRHANFILNKGDARAKDVLKLMEMIKNKVKVKFSVVLEPEIKIWD
ncbi:MAG: UDP-N-acetylmuramate dehydrogenase [Candidatus Omnitrophica bacterium]|nr:UDP-N-acetylmuramate dehydrogenase [Candidatus Omnitrophota bacterium]